MGALYGILGGAVHAELQALGDRLAHRGREAAEWSPGRDIQLGIRGPRRIVDLQEHGPVAFEGAIDNRDQIARLLGRRDGEPAGPAHDASLVFELLDTLGAEALEHLAGPFAVACWHGSERRLLLARDRVGYAPLYFTATAGRFAFASEYKALLTLDGVAAQPDLDALQVVHSTGWSPAGRSCVRDVYPVAPGSCLEVRAGRISSRRYCRIAAGMPATASPSGDALVGALERQVTGYGRIGLALRGSRDSLLLAPSLRAVAGGREIHTVAVGYGRDDPELGEAARMARSLGARHHAVELLPDDLESLLPWLVWHLEEPAGSEELAGVFTAAREAARHVSLLVSGFGLDHFFPGDQHRRLTRLAGRYPLLRTPVSELYDWGRALKAAYHGRRDLPPARVRGAGLIEATGPTAGGAEVRQPDSAIERLYSATGLRLGAPGTDPAFLMTILTESGPTLQQTGRYGGRRQAWALGISGVLDRVAADLLSPDAVRDRGWFEPGDVASLLRRSRGQPYGDGRLRRIWSLLLTELWARTFLDRRGAPPGHPLPPLRSLEDRTARRESVASAAP